MNDQRNELADSRRDFIKKGLGVCSVAGASALVLGLGGGSQTALANHPDCAAVCVKDYGAVGDGSVADEQPAIQAAINAVSAAGGGKVFMPAGTYRTMTPIIVPRFVMLVGDGLATSLSYTGSSWAVQLGDSLTSLSNGAGLCDMYIQVLSVNGTGVRLLCTTGAYLSNLYIEGGYQPFNNTRSNTGVIIDGGSISAFFNTFLAVRTSHFHTGFHTLSTGTSYPTASQFINCTALGDSASDNGSIGWKFSNAPSGQQVGEGTQIVGGNIEACAYGVHRGSSTGLITLTGVRCEISSPYYCIFNEGVSAAPIVVIGCSGIADGQISSGPGKCLFLDAMNGRIGINKLTGYGSLNNSLNVNGNVALTEPDAQTYIYMPSGTSTGKGSIVMQAGGGSSGFGGGISMYGHAHPSRPGHVVAGISTGSGGRFAVNTYGTGNGVDVFAVDENTTAGNTRMLVWDNNSGLLKRVSVGAVNSGGSGYRMLRILN